MVRSFEGVRILSMQERRHRVEAGRRIVEDLLSWSMPLAAAPRLRLQVAERRFAGAAAAVRDALSRRSRPWSQYYPLAVQSGDAALDGRFAFFGIAADEVLAALRSPGLRELLLGCAEVDLVVEHDRVAAHDPQQRNFAAATGGSLGALAVGRDAVRWTELALPVHDRMAELLLAAARACA
jgi:hypothetical protein